MIYPRQDSVEIVRPLALYENIAFLLLGAYG